MLHPPYNCILVGRISMKYSSAVKSKFGYACEVISHFPRKDSPGTWLKSFIDIALSDTTDIGELFVLDDVFCEVVGVFCDF